MIEDHLEATALTPPALNSILGTLESSATISKDQVLLETLLTGVRESGKWPVFQFLDHGLARRGIRRPDSCLEEASPAHVVFDRPLEQDSKVRLTARGWNAADPFSPVLHDGFVPVLRGCVDFFSRTKPSSPSEVQRIVAQSSELWTPSRGTKADLRLVGLLLEVERLGRVEWGRDAVSPWSIELDFQIRRYASVGDLDDYLGIRGSHRPRPEPF